MINYRLRIFHTRYQQIAMMDTETGEAGGAAAGTRKTEKRAAGRFLRPACRSQWW